MLMVDPSVVESIRARMLRLYGAERVSLLMARLELLLGRYRVLTDWRAPAREQAWNEGDVVLIAYGDMVRSGDEVPLETLGRFLDSIVGARVSTLHVLPFFPFSSDDGFAVIDYREVSSEVGDWASVRELAKRWRLMVDLVLNHVSSASRWFRSYCIGMAPERGFFIEVDDGAELNAVVRPRTSALLKEAETPYGKRLVWTTFGADQIDLDFRNPDVLFEFLDLLLLYVENGARVIRLDAVAYLWKEVGTTCIHLWQTHEIVKLFRDVLSLVGPQVLLLTETNVPHEENVAYFGDGDEAQLVYQFSLPPLLLHAIRFQETRHIVAWLKGLAGPPSGCTFLNFTASHDGVGLRPLEGLVPDDEIEQLISDVEASGGMVSRRGKADGSSSAYELNASWYSALTVVGEEEQSVDRFLCSQTIMLGLQGIPALYFNSLFGAENDLAGVAESGRARSINRKKWTLGELETILANPSRERRILAELLRRIDLRKGEVGFHPDNPQSVLDLPRGLLGVKRGSHAGREVVMIANLRDKQGGAAISRLRMGRAPALRDLISGRVFAAKQGFDRLELTPWQVMWVVRVDEETTEAGLDVSRTDGGG